MTTKTCRMCQETKPLDAFPVYRTRGNEYRRGKCRTCYNVAQWEIVRRGREADPEAARAAKTAWNRSPAGRASRQSGRARRRAAERTLPADGSGVVDWLWYMEELDIWHCHLCGGAFSATDELQWDHRDPIAGGTTGTIMANMSAAHASCNNSRNNTPLDQWHERVGTPEGVV